MNKPRKILLVEDEGYVTAQIDEILSRFPEFSVERAENGEKARNLLLSKEYDIVISDIYVYGISGLEVLDRARKKNPEAAVILITGVDNTDLAEKALKNGAYDYLIKPPSIYKLENILKMLKMVKP